MPREGGDGAQTTFTRKLSLQKLLLAGSSRVIYQRFGGNWTPNFVRSSQNPRVVATSVILVASGSDCRKARRARCMWCRIINCVGLTPRCF